MTETTRNGRRLVAALAAAAALATAAPAHAALSAPSLASPATGATVAALPVFAWYPVAQADRYEFQIAADSGFNSPVLGSGYDRFFTRNTRATLGKTVPNGRLYWRVRSVGESGAVSAWSSARWITKAWTIAPTLASPTGGATLTYPASPLRFSWSAVPRAAKYVFTLATDPTLGSTVMEPDETAATSYTPDGSLSPGLYYWAVTPVDAQGNRGRRSAVASFRLAWPSTMSVAVSDLQSVPEVFDPRFSWPLIPGAARYEVEVNSSVDWASGSRVCCSPATTGSSVAPRSLFKNNVYYWRVRAIDAAGNAGVWNEGTSFTKTFDNVPPVTAPSVKNARLRDHLVDPGTDLDATTAGYQTEVPIVVWDPVPGASSYNVDVAPYDDPGLCNWTASSMRQWSKTTATTAWTPLGSGWNNVKPYDDAMSVATDGATALELGRSYCVRVRARSDRDVNRQEVYGDWTYVSDGTGRGTAFTWVGYPAGGECSPSCTPNYLGADDYVAPITGSTNRRTPVFTWKPLSGKSSYFVLVAKDASFNNLVDYAFTQVPAYAPRHSFRQTTYSDETTLYYWAVLPAVDANGNRAVGDPLSAAPDNFQKQSLPPTLVAPVGGSVVWQQPSFRWTAAEAARRYRLQVAQDSTFANPIDDVTTNATEYTSNTTYPADTVLYWRVRAEDENLIGLTWSATGTFKRRLARPVLASTNATIGSMIPTWTWSPVTGAVSYDVAVELPDGTRKTFSDFRSAAFAPTKMTGTGVFRWRVRANFPRSSYGVTPGPYTAAASFTKTIAKPASPTTSVGTGRVVLSWQPRLGVKEYRVQIARRPDFATIAENTTTDNTSYAPALTQPAFVDGGSFYWRVAAVDEDRNVGDFTDEKPFALAKRVRLYASGYPIRRKRVKIVITAIDFERKPVRYAKVRARGAGWGPYTKRTSSVGTVAFYVRAKRYGTVSFRLRKAGYQTATLGLTVR